MGANASDIRESLNAAGLGELENRLDTLAGNLSGGERQFLALATAMLRDPKLLLVDEMSLGLAPIAVTEVANAVKKDSATRRTAPSSLSSRTSVLPQSSPTDC